MSPQQRLQLRAVAIQSLRQEQQVDAVVVYDKTTEGRFYLIPIRHEKVRQARSLKYTVVRVSRDDQRVRDGLNLVKWQGVEAEILDMILR